MTELVADGVDEFAQRLIDRLQDIGARAVKALKPKPDLRILLYPGSDVSWDPNCDGMVWVRLRNMEPASPSSPTRMAGTHACAVREFLVEAELGIIRCAATINEHAEFPSGAQITADGVQSLQDMSELLGVLRCTRRVRSLSTWTPQGPEGGFHGGFWVFTFRVGNCIDCEEVEE